MRRGPKASRKPPRWHDVTTATRPRTYNSRIVQSECPDDPPLARLLDPLRRGARRDGLDQALARVAPDSPRRRAPQRRAAAVHRHHPARGASAGSGLHDRAHAPHDDRSRDERRRAGRADAARRRAGARYRHLRLARARLSRADRAGGFGRRDHEPHRPAVRLHPPLRRGREVRLQPHVEEALLRRSGEGHGARRRDWRAAAPAHAVAHGSRRCLLVAVDVDGLGRVPVARHDHLPDVHRAALQQVRAAERRGAARAHRKPDVAHGLCRQGPFS